MIVCPDMVHVFFVLLCCCVFVVLHVTSMDNHVLVVLKRCLIGIISNCML